MPLSPRPPTRFIRLRTSRGAVRTARLAVSAIFALGLLHGSLFASGAMGAQPVRPTEPVRPTSPEHSTAPAGSAEPAHSTAQDRPTVKLGVLAYLGQDAARQEWLDLKRYLDTALPQYRHEVVYAGLHELKQAVATAELDFVLTNPGHYVELEASHGVRRIATLEHGSNAAFTLGVAAAVVAPIERHDLRELRDLAGHVVAAADPQAFGGYQIIWRELNDLGIIPGRDLREQVFTGFPMVRVLEALDAGRADAGVVRACLLESQAQWRERYKVLSASNDAELGCAVSSRRYPNWPMASLRDTSPTLARAMAIALLQMDADAHGMSWTVPADYQSVHDAFRELKIGPYEYLRAPGLKQFAATYWPWGVILVLLLTAWGAYAWRRATLVRARLRAHQEQVDHMARLSVLGELSSTLAHELSQPLASMNNYAHSLLRRLDNGRLTDDAVREAADNLVALSDTAAGILRRIKGFVRKRPAFREELALPPVVAEAVALFTGMQRDAPHIEIQNWLPAGLTVKADPLQVQQILLNLFKNAQDAMHAMPADQRLLRITLDIADGWARIRVQDTGLGMSESQLLHLFEPFYTTKEDGLGLGLSICKSIAEAHGGQLEGARGPDGRGMIFSLSLPIHESSTASVDPSC